MVVNLFTAVESPKVIRTGTMCFKIFVSLKWFTQQWKSPLIHSFSCCSNTTCCLWKKKLKENLTFHREPRVSNRLHPKMKMVIFTHHNICITLIFLLWNTKGNILNSVGNQMCGYHW